MRLKQLINVAENKRKRIKKMDISNVDALLDDYFRENSFFNDDFDLIEQMEILNKIFPTLKK